MTRQIITRRQKDVSRLLREKRQAYPDKLKAGEGSGRVRKR